MQQNPTKWLTVFILLVATLDRPAAAKKNILDDLLFMAVNQLDKDLLTKANMAQMKDTSLFDDVKRLFDPKPREVTGIDLPINPIPINMMQMTKFLFAFTPINIDPIIEHTMAANGIANTLVLGYDGISHFVNQLGGAVIEQIGNVSRAHTTSTLNTTKITKPKPKQSFTEKVIGAGMGGLSSVIGKFFGKSNASSNKTVSKPTAKPIESSKPSQDTTSSAPAEPDGHHSSDTFISKESSKKTGTKATNKDISKETQTQNATKNAGLFSLLNRFLFNKTENKPKVKETTPSMNTMTTPTEVTTSPEPVDVPLIPSLTTIDDAMMPEFNPIDAMIPEFRPDDVMIPTFAPEFPGIPEQESEFPQIPEHESEVPEKPEHKPKTPPKYYSSRRKNKDGNQATNKTPLGDFLKTMFGQNGTLSKYG